MLSKLPSIRAWRLEPASAVRSAVKQAALVQWTRSCRSHVCCSTMLTMTPACTPHTRRSISIRRLDKCCSAGAVGRTVAKRNEPLVLRDPEVEQEVRAVRAARSLCEKIMRQKSWLSDNECEYGSVVVHEPFGPARLVGAETSQRLVGLCLSTAHVLSFVEMWPLKQRVLLASQSDEMSAAARRRTTNVQQRTGARDLDRQSKGERERARGGQGEREGERKERKLIRSDRRTRSKRS